MNSKPLLLCILIITSAVSTSSQTRTTADELHLKVNKILLKKNLPALVSELSRTNVTGVDDLLLRMDVYKRAGEKEAIRRIIVDLAAAPDLPPLSDRKWLLEIVRRHIEEDLTALRLYYEKLTPDDGYYETNRFIGLWKREGDEKELEAWLAKRVSIWNSWFTINLELRLGENEAQPILNEMAARVRNDPGNKQVFSEYIGAVKRAQEFTHKEKPNPFENETNWLGEFIVLDGALANYEFGDSVREVNPSLAIQYFRKSLGKEITVEEAGALQQRYAVRSSIGPDPPVDWHKQVRYWTKEKLAAAYQRTGQSHLAQPLVEELILAKSDNVMSEKNYSLAGAVQGGSGARVVESKVLEDEATRAQSLGYWSERLNYYAGRSDFDSMENTMREALSRLSEPDKAWFVERIGDQCRYKEGFRYRSGPKLSDIFLRELARSRPESEVTFNIVHAATEYCELADVRRNLFVDRRDMLVAIFEKRLEWDSEERDSLETILEDELVPPAQRTFYISELERIVSRGPVERRLDLASVFERIEDHSRRAAQFLLYLKGAPAVKKNEDSRNYAIRELADAYLDSGQWLDAEKLLERHQALFLPYWGNYLELLAIRAGQQNAPQDAMRFWLKAVNFNGHSRGGLINLGETSTRPLLRDYYLAMKQREPNSQIPDYALKILRY